MKKKFSKLPKTKMINRTSLIKLQIKTFTFEEFEITPTRELQKKIREQIQQKHSVENPTLLYKNNFTASSKLNKLKAISVLQLTIKLIPFLASARHIYIHWKRFGSIWCVRAPSLDQNLLVLIKKCTATGWDFVTSTLWQDVAPLISLWQIKHTNFFIRDRSKFTGYLGRVLGKICLKKIPLIFFQKKSSPP